VNGKPCWPILLGALLAAGIVPVLMFVEYRQRHPEWKKYQSRGLSLYLNKLKSEIHEQISQDQRSRNIAEIKALELRSPEIIEIRAFGGKGNTERCLTCHFGIEDISKSHPNSIFGCVVCHGGNGADLTVTGAHKGLRGGKNPASLDLAQVSCGGNSISGTTCHSGREIALLNRAENIPKSLMATNAGIYSILRFQWGLGEKPLLEYGIKNVRDKQTFLKPIPEELAASGAIDLSSSHFRKFCASCHLWKSRSEQGDNRLQGCPACHSDYAGDGRYKGCDPTVNREESGHAALHSISNRVSDDRCRSCHNRSARIGMNFHGEMESPQYGTPFVNGGMSTKKLSDDRFFTELVPDIHREKSMGCIDCHTGQDTMGDGAIYGWMKDQVEIRCEDCHGSYSKYPETNSPNRDNTLVDVLIRSLGLPAVGNKERIAWTSKGRPLPNVRHRETETVLIGKLSGKEHKINLIAGKKDGHHIRGHERLECDTCHSSWSPQCYGCHQELNFGANAMDHISGHETKGRWVEGRTFYRFEKNILGINSRGRVGILVPGCQVWNSVLDAKGRIIQPYDSKILNLRNGNTSVAMASTHPHTTRREVPRCVDCHYDSKSMGLGEGQFRFNYSDGTMETITTYDSKASGLGIPYSLDAVVNSEGAVLQGTSHSLSRGFNKEELKSIVSIIRCLACHDRYDDPVWEKPGPYVEARACMSALKEMEGHSDDHSGETIPQQ
jgi:hypothetical protein